MTDDFSTTGGANEPSITKLMGESFKLHSQALVGYEDAVPSQSGTTTPTMSSHVPPELEMETTVY